MKNATVQKVETATLKTLPGDDLRQIMWRFSDRYDLQMVVQSTRSVARGPVAHLVAEGGRNSHEWTDKKAGLFKSFDESGITTVFIDPEFGGYIPGPKNLVLGLVAFELAWVDAGAATCSMASNLALAPIHEKGTTKQKKYYMSRCVPGASKETWRGAFALTEPIPYIGVDTGVIGGRVRVAEWKEGKEPVLQIEKRGRFITNMAFANFVTAAVDSDDPRIKGSCMVILEETDPGSFDRGAPTLKLAHQLSSTRDPIFNLKVPASRIIGGYTLKDGVIVPNFNHGEVIESVFMRTRVTPGLMTSAKLLSAIEPVIRYHRRRFRGASSSSAGTPRYELGLQMKEDALHRLVDVWAMGEAGASLGFTIARLLDEYDSIEKEKERIFEEKGVKGPRAQLKIFRANEKAALEYVSLKNQPEGKRDAKRIEALEKDPLVRFMADDAIVNVLIPACKLWNTGQGATAMREAVSLMGGYGITEDCPGFLPYKWMDAQLEATYEGPEAVQRRQLSFTMAQDLFLAQLDGWISELRGIASKRPGTGACTLASAFELWRWTLKHILTAKDADEKDLYQNQRHGVTFPLADALAWLVASRCFILDVVELAEKGPENPSLAEGIEGFVSFYSDLAHTQAVRASGEAARICAELVFGYNRHPSWDGADACCQKDNPEAVAAGYTGCKHAAGNAVEEDGSHALKAGPCVQFDGMETFVRLRSKLDGCLTGSRLAKDRAASALTQVMIPEAMDYPA